MIVVNSCDFIKVLIWNKIGTFQFPSMLMSVQSAFCQQKDFVMTEELEKEFFKADTVSVCGRIEGYSHELGFNIMNLLLRNAMTGEDIPKSVQIEDDGNFHFKYMAYHPKIEKMLMQADDFYAAVDFYVIPGQTTEFVAHLDGTVTYIKMPEGTFARKQSLLHNFKNICSYPNKEYVDDSQSCASFTEFASLTMKKMAERLALVDSISERFDYTPWERHLARCNVMINFGTMTLLFGISKSGNYETMEEYKSILKKSMNLDLYAFMRKMPCNDPTSLVFDMTYSTLNYYAASHIMRGTYLNMEECDMTETVSDPIIAMVDKQIMGSDTPSFFAEMLILTDFQRTLDDMSDEEENIVETYYNAHRSQLSHEALLAQAERLYKDALVSRGVVFELPLTESGSVFRKLLDKYKGKYVMVDFWGMACAPCRAAIKASVELRKELRDNPDVEFVFINASGESTPEAYKEFVDTYLAGEEVYEVSRGEFTQFMELFKFTGIPHYETFDRNGNMVNGTFRYTNTSEDFINLYLEPLKEKLDRL